MSDFLALVRDFFIAPAGPASHARVAPPPAPCAALLGRPREVIAAAPALALALARGHRAPCVAAEEGQLLGAHGEAECRPQERAPCRPCLRGLEARPEQRRLGHGGDNVHGAPPVPIPTRAATAAALRRSMYAPCRHA